MSRKLDQVNAVIEFAKKNGFPEAETIFWDWDNPEDGELGLDEMTGDMAPGDTMRISLGVMLNGSIFAAVDGDGDERPYRTRYFDSQGEADQAAKGPGQ